MSDSKDQEKQKLLSKIKLEKFNLNQINNNILRADQNIDIFSKEIQKWQMNKIEYNSLKKEKESEIIALEKELSAFRE